YSNGFIPLHILIENSAVEAGAKRMSALGQKQTSLTAITMSALCQKQTFCTAVELRYSITSSAVAISDCGTVRPSALAVLRLIMKSNLVGCSTGRSAGLAPLRILSTNEAACRHSSARSGP